MVVNTCIGQIALPEEAVVVANTKKQIAVAYYRSGSLVRERSIDLDSSEDVSVEDRAVICDWFSNLPVEGAHSNVSTY